MPVTVNVNKISVSHQGSDGKLMSFPDVCKTPSPGGPVPIPYPNIAMTSDLSDGTTKVNVDGNPVMTKKSKISTSTGDEAGSALGVLSNKVKGKAQAILYSFDVKFEGQNVVRLTDPALQNMGSANAFGPALLQAPLVVTPQDLEDCKAAQTTERSQTDENGNRKPGFGWDQSGVYSSHQEAFQRVADDLQVTIFIRNGNWLCVDNERGFRWIPEFHQPKGHADLSANSIKKDNIKEVTKWLIDHTIENSISPDGKYYPSFKEVGNLYGILMSKVQGEVGKPLRANKNKFDSNGYKYIDMHGRSGSGEVDKERIIIKPTWKTGDYDLQDVLRHNYPNCVRAAGDEWEIVKWALNREMGWDGIQHGYQAAWEAIEGKKDAEGALHKGETFSMPVRITRYLQDCNKSGHSKVARGNGSNFKPRITEPSWGPDPDNPGKQKEYTRYLAVVDPKLTIVSPNKKPLVSDNDKDAADALICYQCHKLDLAEGEKKEKEMLGEAEKLKEQKQK